jgi:arylsulfatase A-like enzyme
MTLRTLIVALFAILLATPSTMAAPVSKPRNVIFILSDDPGYGDFSCYGAELFKTPHIDKLAAEGRMFTDAHAAPCCSASRYGLMTGTYHWRHGVPGVLLSDAPLSIPTSTATLASVMQKAGYVTGGVGKWHLGLGEGKTDYNIDLKPGPLEIGFDYYFGFPATPHHVPCVYFENHRVVGLDKNDPIRVSFEKADKPGMTHDVLGRHRTGQMSGGKSALWNDETMTQTLLDKALAFIQQNKDRPFFLYYPSRDVHSPCIPDPRFKGTSHISARADMLLELDWSVGQIMAALDKYGIADDTMVIFTSDNGSWLKKEKGRAGIHHPNGVLRGVKFSSYEGGHREPFIVRWPKAVPAGTKCDEPIDLVDMIATFAAMTGQQCPASAQDSRNAWPVFLGQRLDKPIHDYMVFGENKDHLAIRQGPWKLFPKQTGGKEAQLYNLAEDISESKNLAHEHPEKVRELEALLESVRSR